MKGPGNKAKLIARRVWQCPVCQRQLFSDGRAVTLTCPCQQDVASPRPMRLVRELPQKRLTFPLDDEAATSLPAEPPADPAGRLDD